MLVKIISGGQTGADRAALDAALEAGFPAGGYCPSGRRAEDGVIDRLYPLEEIDGGYTERTLKNVRAADATAAFHAGDLSGGTLQTVRFCREEQKPWLEIDLAQLDNAASIRALADFVCAREVGLLNVAGPRASGSPEIYSRVRDVIAGLIALVQGEGQ